MNGNGRPPVPARRDGSTNITVAAMAMQDQQPQHATQNPQTSEQSGLLYDLSSFADPLQAHALQLTASAGLTSLLPPPATPAGGAQHQGAVATGDSSQSSLPQQPIHQRPAPVGQVEQTTIQLPSPSLAPPTTAVQHAQLTPGLPQQQIPYYYLQPPQNATASSLQPIAPAAQQALGPSIVTQPSLLGQQTAQSFILPAAAQGTTIAMPAAATGFQTQIFPSTLAAAPGMIPNLLMTGHPLGSVVNNPPAESAQTPLVPSITHKKRERDDKHSAEANKKRRDLAPSVVSSSTTSTDSNGHGGNSSKRVDALSSEEPIEVTAEMENMTPAERRRYERNLREQQRSYRISQQIKELREVLSESKVPFKSNKYSILLSVVEYIKQLQARAIMLDSEHQKLITTIRQTNEVVNSGTTPSSADETEACNTTSPSDSGSDSEMLFVQGLDYRSVFEQCPAALGIAALDGRILECNPEFQLLLGFQKEELVQQSLFNLVRNHQDIFRAMAVMLKSAEEPVGNDAKSLETVTVFQSRYWSGPVISKKDSKLRMNLTLTVNENGSPKFFNCALTTSATPV